MTDDLALSGWQPVTGLRISVVIPTYCREDLLRRVLAALLAQRYDRNAYEIIVVDDGHRTATRAVVAEFALQAGGAPDVRYLEPMGTRGPAAARNRGWLAARAPLIAFTDDDTVPSRDWLAEGERAMQDDVVAVCGYVRVPTSEPPTDYERNTKGLEGAEFVTANAFVWREALETVGGFDERFTRAWREDSDLHFSLIEAAGPVGHAPNAVVLHPVRPAGWGVSLKQQANVMFDALLYKKHRILYRRKIRARPPLDYYAMVIALPVAVAAWLAHSPGIAAAAGLVWAALTLRLTAKRLRGASLAPSHVAEMVVTSAAIPFLAVFWRIAGAIRYRVLFG